MSTGAAAHDDYLLTDEDRELISAQYSDRPHLRPVLDAVLAAALPLGDVTVQARKTMVTLVSPRRTFAVLQARTKQRLDMGLRLAGIEPHGGLAAARDLGIARRPPKTPTPRKGPVAPRVEESTPRHPRRRAAPGSLWSAFPARSSNRGVRPAWLPRAYRKGGPGHRVTSAGND